MSKKLDLLTKPKFQGSAVSKKPDLLTGHVFQNLAVSKKLDSLTGPIFQNPAVSKKVDLLTEPIFQSNLLRDYVLPKDQFVNHCLDLPRIFYIMVLWVLLTNISFNEEEMFSRFIKLK